MASWEIPGLNGGKNSWEKRLYMVDFPLPCFGCQSVYPFEHDFLIKNKIFNGQGGVAEGSEPDKALPAELTASFCMSPGS